MTGSRVWLNARSFRSRGARALAAVLVTAVASGIGWAEDEPRFTRTEVTVDVPDVQVIDEHGTIVPLRQVLLRALAPKVPMRGSEDRSRSRGTTSSIR